MIAEQLQHPVIAAPVRIVESVRAIFATIGWAMEVSWRVDEAAAQGRIDGEALRKIMAEAGEPR